MENIIVTTHNYQRCIHPPPLQKEKHMKWSTSLSASQSKSSSLGPNRLGRPYNLISCAEVVAVHNVLRLCLQAVHRCPGNTDGGWRARIQKTINLWQQLETEMSQSLCPGCSQRTSLFPLAALVQPLGPGVSVFYFIPNLWAGPFRAGPDLR